MRARCRRWTCASTSLHGGITRSPVSREPPRPPTRAEEAAGPRVHFLRRPGAVRIVAVLMVYKAGDALATGMLRPFLADAGLSLVDIGWLLGTVGFVAGLVGVRRNSFQTAAPELNVSGGFFGGMENSTN